MNNQNLYIRSTVPYLFTIDHILKLQEYGFSIMIEDDHPLDQSTIEKLNVKLCKKGEWIHRPHETIIIGAQEVEESQEPLTQRHICYSSLFNEKIEKSNILSRFFWGNGRLFDLSFITKQTNNAVTMSDQDKIVEEISSFLSAKLSDNLQKAETAFINIITNYTP